MQRLFPRLSSFPTLGTLTPPHSFAAGLKSYTPVAEDGPPGGVEAETLAKVLAIIRDNAEGDDGLSLEEAVRLGG